MNFIDVSTAALHLYSLFCLVAYIIHERCGVNRYSSAIKMPLVGFGPPPEVGSKNIITNYNSLKVIDQTFAAQWGRLGTVAI